jgi:hypothetical protein
MVQKFIYRKNRARRNRNQDLIISRKGAKAAELKDKKDGKVGPLRAWRLGARMDFGRESFTVRLFFVVALPSMV